MYYPGRLCIPFGLSCNFNCKYCFRCSTNSYSIPTKLDSRFSDYLSNLPERTYAVIASGGEPLLYIDTIKEVFNLLPSHCHKKIMTNGYLLTDSLVEYINDNDIEIHLSYDGEMTSKLRGYDILDNSNLLRLVRKIKNLLVVSVVTNLNPDIIKNYNYVINKLGRSDIYYRSSLILPTKYNKNLIKGFDAYKYVQTLIEYDIKYNKQLPYEWLHPTPNTNLGFNYLLDGTIVGIHSLKKYGSAYDDYSEVLNNYYNIESLDFCNNYDCNCRYECCLLKHESNNFSCKVTNLYNKYISHYW